MAASNEVGLGMPIQQFPGAHRIIARNTMIAKASIFVGANKRDNVSVEERLGEQFRYYRREFIEYATLAGVTVPLDIVEDTTGRIFNFVKHNGPKYILQILQSNSENTHLLRCALSLLIVTIHILRRKLPETEGGAKQSGWMSSMSETISAWAASALHQISEGSAVGTCIGLLISAHVPSVQELTLSLLSAIVSTSEDAVTQMFQNPNSNSNRQTNSHGSSHGSQKKRIFPVDGDAHGSGTKSRGTVNASRKNTQMSTTHTTNTRNSTMVAGGQQQPVQSSQSVKRTSISLHNEEKAVESFQPQSGSCLSLMLSIAALHRNRHLIIAGVAEVIIALSINPEDNTAFVVAKTPTCPLPLENDSQNGKNKPSSSYLRMKQDGSDNTQHGPKFTGKLIEWAGIKILFKFLSRFLNFNDGSIVHYVSRREREEMSYAFGKVLLAVVQLVTNSREVLEFVLEWKGAEEILRLSFAKISTMNNSALTSKIDACLSLLESYKMMETESSSLASRRSRESVNRNTLSSPISSIGDHANSSVSQLTPIAESMEIEPNKPSSRGKVTELKKVSSLPTLMTPSAMTMERPGTSPKPMTRERILERPRPKTSQNPPTSTSLSASMSRDFFSSLPATPTLPRRLEQQDIVEGVEEAYFKLDRQEMVDYDQKVYGKTINPIDKIANIVVSKAKHNGAMMNGKLFIPREERYRRVYSPNKCPFDFDSLKSQMQSQFHQTSHNNNNNNNSNKQNQSHESAHRAVASRDPDEDEVCRFLQQSEISGFKIDGIDFEKPNVFDEFPAIYASMDMQQQQQPTQLEPFSLDRSVTHGNVTDDLFNEDDFATSIIPDENIAEDDGINVPNIMPSMFRTSSTRPLPIDNSSDIIFH